MRFGSGVKVVEPVNLYECTIGDEAFIGPFVEIQRGVRVGNRTRIQSHSFICEGVTIGEDCFIGHGVMFINDTFESGDLPMIRQSGRPRRSVMGCPSVPMLRCCRYRYVMGW